MPVRKSVVLYLHIISTNIQHGLDRILSNHLVKLESVTLYNWEVHGVNENPCKKPYLCMKVCRYVSVADLVRQLESSAEERITDMASWRWGSQKILHSSNSKAALANVDKSLFDVSFRKKITFLQHVLSCPIKSMAKYCEKKKNIEHLE